MVNLFFIFVVLISSLTLNKKIFLNAPTLDAISFLVNDIDKPSFEGANINNMEHYKNLSLESIDGEIWKDVLGYERLYQISNLGRVKSLDRAVPHIINGERKIKQKILSQCIDRYGYCKIILHSNGEKRYFTAHRLSAISLLSNEEGKPCVNHINGIKTDNRIENLEWCTWGENELHSYRVLGKIYKNPATGKKGKNNWNSVPILQFDLNNKFIKKWDSFSDVKRAHGFDAANILTSIMGKKLKGTQKTAYGYNWKYA